nr:hypothetical protein [Tanacetum cinerariifolium]
MKQNTDDGNTKLFSDRLLSMKGDWRDLSWQWLNHLTRYQMKQNTDDGNTKLFSDRLLSMKGDWRDLSWK